MEFVGRGGDVEDVVASDDVGVLGFGEEDALRPLWVLGADAVDGICPDVLGVGDIGRLGFSDEAKGHGFALFGMFPTPVESFVMADYGGSRCASLGLSEFITPFRRSCWVGTVLWPLFKARYRIVMAKDLALRVSHLSGHKSDGFAYIVVGVGRLAIGRIVMAIHLALSVSFLSGHKSDGFA